MEHIKLAKQRQELMRCLLAETKVNGETLRSILSVNTQIQDQTDELEAQLRSIEQTIVTGVQEVITTIEQTTAMVNQNLHEIRDTITDGNVILSQIKTGVDTVDTSINNLDTKLQARLKEVLANQVLSNSISIQISRGIEQQNLTLNDIRGIATAIADDIDQIRQNTSQIIAKIEELINKPEATEILGCIEVSEIMNTETPSAILGLYGMRIITVGEPTSFLNGLNGVQTNVLGSTVVIKYAGETLETIPRHILRERFLQAYQGLSLVNNNFKFDAYFEGKGNDGEVFVITDVPITDFYNRRLYKTIQATNQISVNISKNTSLVKQFDKSGNEIVANRKYYVNGSEVPSSQIQSFTEGQCPEEPIDLSKIENSLSNLETITNSINSGVTNLAGLTQQQTETITTQTNAIVSKIEEVRVLTQQGNNTKTQIYNTLQGVRTDIAGLRTILQNIEVDTAAIQVILNTLEASLTAIERDIEEEVAKPNVTEILGCLDLEFPTGQNSLPNIRIITSNFTDSKIQFGGVTIKEHGVTWDAFTTIESQTHATNVVREVTGRQNVYFYASNHLFNLGVEPDYFLGIIPLSRADRAMLDDNFTAFDINGNSTVKTKSEWSIGVGGITIKYRETGSLVKEFDKLGNEILSKRKYYIGGTLIPNNQVKNFTEGECKECTKEVKNERVVLTEKLIPSGSNYHSVTSTYFTYNDQAVYNQTGVVLSKDNINLLEESLSSFGVPTDKLAIKGTDFYVNNLVLPLGTLKLNSTRKGYPITIQANTLAADTWFNIKPKEALVEKTYECGKLTATKLYVDGQEVPDNTYRYKDSLNIGSTTEKICVKYTASTGVIPSGTYAYSIPVIADVTNETWTLGSGEVMKNARVGIGILQDDDWRGILEGYLDSLNISHQESFYAYHNNKIYIGVKGVTTPYTITGTSLTAEPLPANVTGFGTKTNTGVKKTYYDTKSGETLYERYYVGKEEITLDRVLSLTFGECEGKGVYTYQKLVKNSTLTVSNVKSIAFTVTSGTVNFTMTGNPTITYPIEDVKGVAYTDANMISNFTFDATNGEVLVTYIRK